MGGGGINLQFLKAKAVVRFKQTAKFPGQVGQGHLRRNTWDWSSGKALKRPKHSAHSCCFALFSQTEKAQKRRHKVHHCRSAPFSWPVVRVCMKRSHLWDISQKHPVSKWTFGSTAGSEWVQYNRGVQGLCGLGIEACPTFKKMCTTIMYINIHGSGVDGGGGERRTDNRNSQGVCKKPTSWTSHPCVTRTSKFNCQLCYKIKKGEKKESWFWSSTPKEKENPEKQFIFFHPWFHLDGTVLSSLLSGHTHRTSNRPFGRTIADACGVVHPVKLGWQS